MESRATHRGRMKVISPLLKHVVYPGLSRSGYLRRSARGGPAVVTYHGILPPGYNVRDPALDGHLVTAEAFAAQIRLLQSKYNVISPQEFLQWREGELRLPPRAVLLTCDDGLLNTLTDMLPLVEDFHVPFLFFVTGGSLLQTSSTLWYEQLFLWLLEAEQEISLVAPWGPCRAEGREQKRSLWREMMRKLSVFEAGARNHILQDMRTQLGISEDCESEYSQNRANRRRFFMLNVTELRQLADAGMTIGAHTLSHPMLSQMPEDLALQEISQGRAGLEAALGKPVWAMAYPFGNSEAVSAREPELAARAGFRCAFMNVEDGNRNRSSNSDDAWFAFPRIHVSSTTTPAELEAHVSGFYRSVREKYLHSDVGVSA
jgi:peptidoglycan/xylan/chitin deacetylase (PgdA/CDA1 family)